jgi:hypothetical protein
LAVAGAAGAGGTDPAPEPCIGCARLSVPLDAAGDFAHYTIVLPTATNLSAATIAFRVVRVEGSGGMLRGYVQQGESAAFGYRTGPATMIADLTTVTQDIAWNLAPIAGSFDLTAIARIGIEITAQGSSTWENPTVIDVDRILVSGASPASNPWNFDSADSIYATPVEIWDPGPMWLNSFSADTTAAGSTIAWIGP